MPPAPETYLPRAQRLQRDIERAAQDAATDMRTLDAHLQV